MADVYSVSIVIKKNEESVHSYGGMSDPLNQTARDYSFSLLGGNWSEAKQVIAKAYESIGGSVLEEDE